MKKVLLFLLGVFALGRGAALGEVLPNGGPYVATVIGVEVTFEIRNGGAWIGTSEYDQGVPEATSGTVTIPEKLGGCPVVGIHDSAFYRCRSIEKLVFEGDEPEVEDGAFSRASIGQVLVSRTANWPKPLPTSWQGFSIGYGPSLDLTIRVTASVPDGTRFVDSLSVSLAAGVSETIWYTTDGSDPKTSSTRRLYKSPIEVSETLTLKYYAVNASGDWGEVTASTYTKRRPDGGSYAEKVDGIIWWFSVENGRAVITGVEVREPWGDSGQEFLVGELPEDVVVPGELGGCPVTELGDSVFSNSHCWNLRSVVLPEGLETIGSGAFHGCDMLRSVVLPEGLKTIGASAFSVCYGLRSIELPTGLTTIEPYAFQYCGLRSIKLPEGLTAIGDEAFEYCEGLRSIVLPASLMIIGNWAFEGCPNLLKVRMEGDVPPVDDECGLGLRLDCTIYVHKGSTGWNVPIPGEWRDRPIRYIEDAAFTEEVEGVQWHSQMVGHYVNRLVPDADLGVRDLAEGAVRIPAVINWKPVTALGRGLFEGASRMTSVEIPPTVTAIDDSAFRACTRLESVTLPEGLCEIGDSAFERCTSLKSIVIPASVTNIGYFAFRDCLRLETIELQGKAPQQDLGVVMGVPAFTTISGRLGAATAIVYASVTNKTDEITVPMNWLDELAIAHDAPAGFASYEAAFREKFGTDLAAALTKPTGKHDLKGNPLQVWQDCVAGTDPLNEEDQFVATVSMVNGVPKVRWSPELPPERAALRKYTIYGATALNGAWVDVSGLSDEARQAAGYQFFRVTVEMK